MKSENDLIQKLMVSKAIMDRHNNIPRSGDSTRVNVSTPTVENFEAPAATYNLPEEFIQESKIQQPKVVTTDKIMSSKLPDEIKKLMIEHPITPQNPMSGPTLSDDLINKASRLMNSDAGGKQIKSAPQRQVVSENVLDNRGLRNMLKEVVEEVLLENGILSESTEKTNETLSFRVGNHVFEGKVTKIKKLK